MSTIFTVCGVDDDEHEGVIRNYFTSDRRTARKLSRETGMPFRALRGERQVCYGGGDRPATIIADSILKTANL